MNQINFLENQQKIIRKRAKGLFKTQIFAFGMLVAYGLVLAAVFANYFILSKEAKTLDDKISEQRQAVTAAVDTETKQFYLKNKTGSLMQVLAGNQNNKAIIENFFNLLPEGMEINNFNITDSGQLNFQSKASGFSAITRFLDTLKKGNLGEQPIYDVEIDNFSVNSETGYSFSITIFLQPEKKSQESQPKEGEINEP